MRRKKRQKARTITRYDSRAKVPKSKRVSGKVYKLYQVKETKKSADQKAARLRKEGYSARVSSFKLKGKEKMYYAIYKRGSKK